MAVCSSYSTSSEFGSRAPADINNVGSKAVCRCRLLCTLTPLSKTIHHSWVSIPSSNPQLPSAPQYALTLIPTSSAHHTRTQSHIPTLPSSTSPSPTNTTTCIISHLHRTPAYSSRIAARHLGFLNLTGLTLAMQEIYRTRQNLLYENNKV